MSQARTPGQTIVDVDFAATGEIAELKQKFADLIDEMFAIDCRPQTHRQRCQQETVALLESACMYAVKCITRPL